MTAASLLQDLQAVSCHALTDTNVEAVCFDGGRLWLECVDRDADKIAELKEELADANAEAKEARDEADELQAKLDALTGEQMDAADREAEIDRFRETARGYAVRCQKLETEAAILRKRKGMEAGYVAHYREVMAYLHGCNADPKAMELCRKIRGLE